MGIWVLGMIKDLVGDARLDNLALVHNQHAVAEGTNNFEIVGNKQICEVVAFLQFAQQLDYLKLHRAVER